jgi:hypothetical protein
MSISYFLFLLGSTLRWFAMREHENQINPHLSVSRSIFPAWEAIQMSQGNAMTTGHARRHIVRDLQQRPRRQRRRNLAPLGWRPRSFLSWERRVRVTWALNFRVLLFYSLLRAARRLIFLSLWDTADCRSSRDPCDWESRLNIIRRVRYFDGVLGIPRETRSYVSGALRRVSRSHKNKCSKFSPYELTLDKYSGSA